MKTAIIITACMIGLPQLASAAQCHFKTEAAIVCTDPKNAAIAFDRFGYATSEIEKSYNLEILRESGCGIRYKNTYKTASIEQQAIGKVALQDGWAKVLRVIVNRSDMYYVSPNYIEGTCRKFVPETDTIQSLAPSADASFDSQDNDDHFRCPESLSSDAEKEAAMKESLLSIAKQHPKFTLREIVNARMHLLESHHCTQTLEKMQANQPSTSTTP